MITCEMNKAEKDPPPADQSKQQQKTLLVVGLNELTVAVGDGEGAVLVELPVWVDVGFRPRVVVSTTSVATMI